MKIVENVLDNVPAHTQCAFILPDKKLEKASKAQMKRILKNHRLRKVIKLPEDLFFGVGITTSTSDIFDKNVCKYPANVCCIWDACVIPALRQIIMEYMLCDLA